MGGEVLAGAGSAFYFLSRVYEEWIRWVPFSLNKALNGFKKGGEKRLFLAFGFFFWWFFFLCCSKKVFFFFFFFFFVFFFFFFCFVFFFFFFFFFLFFFFFFFFFRLGKEAPPDGK